HYRDKRITLDGTDNRQTCPRVTAGQFNHRLTWTQPTIYFSLFDHLPGDAVFLGEAWIQVFELGENPPVQIARDARQLHQWGTTDDIDDRSKGMVSHGLAFLNGAPLPCMPAAAYCHPGLGIHPAA